MSTYINKRNKINDVIANQHETVVEVLNMVLNAFLSEDENTKIAKTRTLYITKKTVKFGDDVYQFCNVTGFGIGEVKPKRIPIMVILAVFFWDYL